MKQRVDYGLLPFLGRKFNTYTVSNINDVSFEKCPRDVIQFNSKKKYFRFRLLNYRKPCNIIPNKFVNNKEIDFFCHIKLIQKKKMNNIIIKILY